MRLITLLIPLTLFILMVLLASLTNRGDAKTYTIRQCNNGEIGHWGYLRDEKKKAGQLFLSDKNDDFNLDDVRCLVHPDWRIMILSEKEM